MTTTEPAVYLLHFETRYHHARHYVGFVADGDAQRRLQEHLSGQGSALVRAVASLRVSPSQLVLAVSGDRGLERRWHNRHGHGAALCPRCKARRPLQYRLHSHPGAYSAECRWPGDDACRGGS
jgi:hypothetical protein